MSDDLQSMAFVVDDDPDMRESLKFLIESAGIPVQSYASATDFLATFDSRRSGCLICDVRMPEMSGLDLFEHLSTRGNRLPVILMTAFADVPMAIRALKLGVADFIEKPFDTGVMLERIRQVLSEDCGRRALLDQWDDFSRRMESLTDKERVTLDLMIDGAPNKAIAAQLEVTERAVEVRRSSIMKKLNVSSFAELVRQVTHFEVLFADRRPSRIMTQRFGNV